MKANAVVFRGPNEVSFEAVNCPDPSDDQVVVKVTQSWISNGTEGSYLRGERIEGDTPWRPGDPLPFPIVAGYQKVGIVDWVGSNVSNLQVGDSVFVTISDVEGMFETWGGHISPSVSNRNEVYKLPPGLDPVAYSGLVLAQVGFNCGDRPRLEPGDGAVVVGDGMVGQWAAQTLANRGAEVVLVGRHEDRLKHFTKGQTLLEEQGNWVESIKDRFPNGVQVAVDTVGSVDVMNQFFDIMRTFGHLVSAGFYGTDDSIALQPLRYKELSIDLVSGWTNERMARTLDEVANGNLDTLSLITHRFPVTRAAEAWDLIESKKEPVLGVVLDWT